MPALCFLQRNRHSSAMHKWTAFDDAYMQCSATFEGGPDQGDMFWPGETTARKITKRTTD
jgi:hypothetical protein